MEHVFLSLSLHNISLVVLTAGETSDRRSWGLVVSRDLWVENLQHRRGLKKEVEKKSGNIGNAALPIMRLLADKPLSHRFGRDWVDPLILILEMNLVSPG